VVKADRQEDKKDEEEEKIKKTGEENRGEI
jgi:hypothetical protein